MRKITMIIAAMLISFSMFAQNLVDDGTFKKKESSQQDKYDRAPITQAYTPRVTGATKDNLLSEGLNGGSVPAGWSVVDVTGTTGDVTFVTASTNPLGFSPTEGTHFARFNSYTANNTKVRLGQTTSFATTGFINIAVNFDWSKDNQYSSSLDSVYVQWSTDGTTWNTAGGVGRYQASGDSWTPQSFTLPSGANGQANLYIGFLFVSHYGNDCHLDNIVVTGDPLVANDLAVTNWIAPANGSNINPADIVTIEITNNGTDAQDTFDIAYSINGGMNFVTETIIDNIAAGASEQYSFATTANMGVYTTYNCVAFVILDGDANTSNDTLVTTITKSEPSYIDTCYPQMAPLWTGTIANNNIILDSSYIVTLSEDSLVGWAKFDVSSIPDNAIISNVQLNAYVNDDNWAYFSVNSLEYDPMTNIDSIFNDARDGNEYFNYTANFPNPGWFTNNLAGSASTDLSANLVNDWFGVGFYEYETGGAYYLEYDGWNEPNKPFIVVNYTLPLSLDVALTGFVGIASGYNPSNQVTVTIKNLGTDTVTDIPVSYIFGTDTVTEIAAVTLANGETYNYTFTQVIDVSAAGTYNLTAYVSYPGDIKASNNEISTSFVKWEEFYPLSFAMDVSGLTASYGPQFQDGKFYISRWNDRQVYVIAPDTAYTMPVTVLAAATGFRDLGGDGDSLYGSTNNTTLREGVVENDTVKILNSMTVGTAARGVDYDPNNNAIWICNWNAGTEDFRLVNKNTGATIQTVTNPNATLYGIGGLAYDYWTPGGPYLVGFSQHNHGNQLVWIKIADGTVLVDHDVTQDIPEAITAGAISGGAYLTKDLEPGKVIIGGVIQNFRLFGYEMITTDVTAFDLQGQLNSNVDVDNKFITVTMPFNASLNNVVTTWALSHDSAKVLVNGAIVNSGDAFDYINNDTADFQVVYYNVFGTDSVVSSWSFVVHLTDAPVVTTDAATNIDMTSATINGTIDPNDNNFTSIYFEYGLTTAYGDYAAPTVTIATGSDPIAFSADISSLTANTTYHYRIVGVLSTGDTIEGNDTNFTTLNMAAPVFTTTAATNIDFTTADVNGTVDANSNTVTDISFLIGTATGVYTDTVVATPNTLSTDTAEVITAALTGLTSNTTYYFRAYGMLGAAVYTGSELSFTTLNATLTVAPATHNVSLAAGSVDFLVTANQSWTASSDQTWCTVTASGTGNDTITATYTENTGFTARTATITVTGGVAGTQTVTVVQAGVVATLAVTPPSANVTATAGTTNFTVTSNQGWTAASNQTWCTVTASGTGNGTITATYGANAGASPRTATITVTGAQSGTQTVTVVQAAGLVLAQIYDNGAFITNPGAGAGGANVSAIQTGLSSYGFSMANTGGYRVADNADLHNDTTYVVKQLKFYGYQTLASNPNPTTSTFTGVNFKVWNGSPMNGGTVLYDYSANNMMSSTAWSGVYRTSGTALTNTDRSIMEIVATLPATDSLVLSGTGDYWIDWSTTGSGASGPWANPLAAVGATVTGDAVQWIGTEWQAVLDGSTGTGPAQGLPFKLYGRKVYTPAPTPTLNATPATLAFGNQVNGTTSAAQTYTLTGSNLTANVTVTAPAGFQVSLNGTSFATSQVVTPASGSVNQTIHVRFAPTAVQAYTGNVTNASTGATTVNVAVTGAGVVGIAELGTINVSIYPNPAKEKLFVNAGERIESVRVLNLLGETIYTAKVNDVTAEINTSTFAEGSYVIMVISNNGQAMRKFQVIK